MAKEKIQVIPEDHPWVAGIPDPRADEFEPLRASVAESLDRATRRTLENLKRRR